MQSSNLLSWFQNLSNDVDACLDGTREGLQAAVLAAEQTVNDTPVVAAPTFLTTCRCRPDKDRFGYLTDSGPYPDLPPLEAAEGLGDAAALLERLNLKPSDARRAHTIVACVCEAKMLSPLTPLLPAALAVSSALIWRYFRYHLRRQLSRMAVEAVLYALSTIEHLLQLPMYMPAQMLVTLCSLHERLLFDMQTLPTPVDLREHIHEMYLRQEQEYAARMHFSHEFDKVAAPLRRALIQRRASLLQLVSEGKPQEEAVPLPNKLAQLFTEFGNATRRMNIDGSFPQDAIFPPPGPASMSTEGRELVVDPELCLEGEGFSSDSIQFQNTVARELTERRLETVPPIARMSPRISDDRLERLLALIPAELPIQHPKMALCVRLSNPYVNPGNPYICDACYVPSSAGFQAVVEEGRFGGFLIRNAQGFDLCPACAVGLFDEACRAVSGSLLGPLPDLPARQAEDGDIPFVEINSRRRPLLPTIALDIGACRWVEVRGVICLDVTVGVSPLGTRPFGRMCLPSDLPEGNGEGTLPPPVDWLAASTSTARQIAEESVVDTCSICLEALETRLNFEGTEGSRPSHRSVVQTTCHHWFHSHCLESYFAVGNHSEDAPCPLCRCVKCLSPEQRSPDVVMSHNRYNLRIPVPESAIDVVAALRAGDAHALGITLVVVVGTAVSLDCAVRGPADVGSLSTLLLYRQAA